MNLIIDTGNTLTKLAIFHGDEMVAFTSFAGIEVQQIVKFCGSDATIEKAILSTVRDYPDEMGHFLAAHFATVFFDHHTPVPLANEYGTPETLGKDRLAGVVGARNMMPSGPLLVIDAGTALTYDIVTAGGEYLGGAISPGLSMRFKALHTFTGRLPLLHY